MRLPGHLLALTLCLLLGLATGVATVAVHRSLVGLVLGVVATCAATRALGLWLPRAAPAFAGGWLVVLVAAVAGRDEGDYAVASDLLGWLLIGSGLPVLVVGLVSGRTRGISHDSAGRGGGS